MECSKEDWAGIIPRLFPNAHFVECVASGSMYQFAPVLKHFAVHLPNGFLVSTQQARSEFLGSTLTHVALLRMPQYMLWPV